MAKEKVNNHYVTRAQLNRFRIPLPPKGCTKYTVWVYEKGLEPRAVNTKRAASEDYFYGRQDDDLENAFADFEGRCGTAIEATIRNRAVGTQSGRVLDDLSWMLSFRTKALRERLRSMFSEAAVALGRRTSSEAIQDRFWEAFEEKAAGLPRVERRRAKAEAKRLLESGAAESFMKQGLQSFASMFSNTDMVDDAHNDGLKEFLSNRGKCPDPQRAHRWVVVTNDDPLFVIGDSGVFSVTRMGEVSATIASGADWYEVYLPLDPVTVAVGLRHEGDPALSGSAIVAGAVAASHSQFFSSYASPDLRKLADDALNSRGEFLTPDQLNNIVDEVWTPHSART